MNYCFLVQHTVEAKSLHAQIIIIFYINLLILFIYFWLLWVFVAVHGLSLVAASEGYSLLQ